MLRIRLSPEVGEEISLPGLPGWLSRLLSARGVRTQEDALRFLHPALDQLLPPKALAGLEKAADVLLEAKAAGKRTVIYGDYDVDGVYASAILYEALGILGMEREVYIPDRHGEGYGLNTSAVEKLAKDFGVLVTVDCGITAVEEVAAAREAGMRVIVTDHHRHGELLPSADAVTTPLLGDYPFPFLCGAGVAWKLALLLIGDRALPLMELAALATIADMVPLTGENRVIAALGLQMLSQTRRPGLRAVMNRAGLSGSVTSDQAAFQIAPRMNACGRMDTANTALRMLLTKDENEGEALALRMETLNQERRDQEAKALSEALDQVSQIDLVEKRAIVVSGEGWNSGVVGLVAGRIAEKYAYPTVVLSREGGLCVGSARSAGEIDIHRALSRCADLFERFGGHKQAAGLTIRADRLRAFDERLTKAVAEQTGGGAVIPEVLCDGAIRLSDVTEETVAWLSRLEPFGIGNPSPRFLVEDAEAMSLRAVGAQGRHLKCTFRQEKTIRDGIFFGGGDWAGQTAARFRMAISPTLNEFRGRVSAECRLSALEIEPESLTEDRERACVALMREARGDAPAPEITDSGLEKELAGNQGALLVCRRLQTALSMRGRFPDTDFCLQKADDPRAFHTVLLYGCADAPAAPFRTVILCDGDTGEAAAWQRACPGAKVLARGKTEGLKELLSFGFADVDALRNAYAALRRAPARDLYVLADDLGLRPGQTAFALSALSQIGLLAVQFSPFRVTLLPMVKRSPEESGLYRLARCAKEEMYGVYGL